MEERGIIATVIIGFIVGLVARFVKPGDDKSGLVMTTILGIIGAFVGSFIGQAFGIYGPNERAGFIGAVVGAIIVLALVNAFNKKRALP
ncbi:GlsB/YeaQ/YmgE family stress response membrane protein [Pseudobdellovibrio sp. HCB154]|uniref:GlsB/YeaQ/YmgE family stress response membrane protein n=1 Tax=Pseudobdellovibrio sp. HCB154 TaxID=3386277 RepID=UPI003917331B